MTTKLVSLGYTGAGWLDVGYDFEKLMMPSCQIGFASKPMMSRSVFQFGREVQDIRRTKSAYINDVPEISLNLSFEPETKLLSRLLYILARKRNEKLRFKYQDKDSGISWQFDEIYVSSLSFSVSEHTILSVSMTFFVMTDSIYYGWDELELNEVGRDTLAPITLPIGYYRWKLKGQDYWEIPDVTEFSFGFTQEVIPQYECRGKLSDEAPTARNIHFGLPSITFGLSQTMHLKTETRYNDVRTQMNRQNNLLENKLTFCLYNVDSGYFDDIFELTGVKEISSTPELIGNGFKIVKRDYSVSGRLEVLNA